MVDLGEMHRMKLLYIQYVYLGFFTFFKGANLPLVFTLCEISVDSEKNLPPDARF